MRKLVDSDLFTNEINKHNAVLGKVKMIMGGTLPGTVLLNEILYPEIKRKIIDKRKERIMNDIGQAIMDGRLLLITTRPEDRLTDILPFIVYTRNGRKEAIVNLCSIVKEVKNDDGSIDYELGDNVEKIRVSIYSAYLALNQFDEQNVLSTNIMYDAAVIWAEMFNKPLYDIFSMTNSERYIAFKYFAMKFFVVYFMGCDEKTAEAIAVKGIDKKNELILYMEDKIYEKNMDIYSGVIPYLRAICDAEISRTQGVRVANISNSMNVSFYILKFSQTYGSNALLSLCSFPYFIYTVISAVSKTKMMKDKSFDRVFQTNSREINRLLIESMKD